MVKSIASSKNAAEESQVSRILLSGLELGPFLEFDTRALGFVTIVKIHDHFSTDLLSLAVCHRAALWMENWTGAQISWGVSSLLCHCSVWTGWANHLPSVVLSFPLSRDSSTDLLCKALCSPTDKSIEELGIITPEKIPVAAQP